MKKLFSIALLISLVNPMFSQDWNLVWSDEFNGTSLDESVWNYEIGTGSQYGLWGWGNNELQYYTDSPDNVSVSGGNLHITALEQSVGGMDYTSARLTTRSNVHFTYGKIEARMQLVEGQGLWPAFWMLVEGGDPNTSVSAFWPGEIDVMEIVGHNPNSLHGTAHYGVPGGVVSTGGTYVNSESLANNFHNYTIEWYPDNIIWYIDDIEYYRLDRSDVFPNNDWLFDIDYFLLLNLAVGGNWPGAPDATTQFPADMLVDYVRVYEYDETINPAVTFRVDVSDQNLSATDVVYLNGSFNSWCGTCHPMTDQGNGIWTTQLNLSPGIHEYKHTINGWDIQENFVEESPCTISTYADGTIYTNRKVNVGFEEMVLEIYCFNECSFCEGFDLVGCTDDDATNYDSTALTDDGSCLYNVYFSVDMNQSDIQNGEVVYLNGTFNGWCGDCNPMTDADNDGVWYLVLALPPGVIEYKFTTSGWGGLIESFEIGESCTLTTFGGEGEVFTNRVLTITDSPIDNGAVCFNECSSCVFPESDVTFRVAMNDEVVDGTGVFLVGSWNGNLPIQMNNLGYGVYEIAQTIEASSSVSYSFFNGILGESSPEPCFTSNLRTLVVPVANTILDIQCFNFCEPCYGCNDPFNENFNPFVIHDEALCGDPILYGCTYVDASNYNSAANLEDGSCVFAIGSDCPSDLTGDGVINAADLLEFLSAFGNFCN